MKTNYVWIAVISVFSLLGCTKLNKAPEDTDASDDAATVDSSMDGGVEASAEPLACTPYCKLTPTDIIAHQRFGEVVAVDGNTIAVGAADDTDRGADAGAVYVFDLQADNTWKQTDKITADGTAGLRFGGRSIALRGNRMAIGTHTDDSVVDNAGSVFIFERSGPGEEWVQIKKLTANSMQEGLAHGGQFFGTTLALEDDRLFVGANGDNRGTPDLYHGAVFVFTRQPNGDWTGNPATDILRADSESTAPFHDFGLSMSLDGDILAVGADHYDEPGQGLYQEVGAVYIFERQSDGTWMQTIRLEANPTHYRELFGFRVAVQGSLLLVSTALQDATTEQDGTESGIVHVYRRVSSTNWEQVSTHISQNPSSEDHFGIGLAAVDENTFIIGAEANSQIGSVTGAALVYRHPSEGIWSHTETLRPEDLGADARFGRHISASSTWLTVGAPGFAEGATSESSAYVFNVANLQ